MNYRIQKFGIFPLLVLLVTSCNLPSSSIDATPTNFPATSAALLPTAIPGPNEYITIAQLNFWFTGPGCGGGFEAFDCSGKRNTHLTPLLGETYNNASQDVIRQQIDWATEYGVDAFSIEWTTPRGIPGSLEVTLDDNFLKAPTLNKIRWCIFYDLSLRIQQTPVLNVDLSRGMDFNNPNVYNTFVADFEHFARKYFNQAEYLKIDGRPVVYIWGTWNAIGRYADAFLEARAKAAALGFDVYIVGDIIRTDHFYPDLAAAYDADTNMGFFVPGPPTTAKNVGEAATSLDGILTQWEKNIVGLNVRGREEKVILQPGFAPQYDDRLFREGNNIPSPTYIPALSKAQVVEMAMVVRQHARPVGSQGWKLVWLNTWNNWPETTTFEPTANQGPKYPAGNYQFDMLEVVRDVFGPQTFGNGAPFPATEIPPRAPATETLQSTQPPGAETPLEEHFTGTWEGPDPADGSITTLVLVQAKNSLTGTFKDSYSTGVQPPGYEGSGSGTVLSASTAQMTFNLNRWDGRTVQATFSLTLSNQNNTLTLGCNAGCPIILQRQ
jgi:hypothetical protein